MEVHKFIPITLAAKLLGLSPQKAHAAARAGRFGPVLKGERHGTRGPCETLVISTRGVELASGILLTEQALEWASDCPDGQFPILAEAIGGSPSGRAEPVADEFRISAEIAHPSRLRRRRQIP